MIQRLRFRKWKKIIEKSGLFDSEYYLFTYPDVRSQDVDPVMHYVVSGASERRNPNPFFNSSWYLSQYPDVAKTGQNPLVHYLEHGASEGRNPNKDFDTEFYLNRYPDVRESGVDPLLHYMMFGEKEKRLTNSSLIAKDFNIENEITIPKIDFDQTKNEFVDYIEHEPLKTKLKTIAFYLPQFHPFLENDKWWGKGFTEWTNVTKAKPNFKGHYQPHLPIHFGFYDLRVPEVLVEQARLARNYGIYGFNFYYYWFDGKVLMHKPYEILLEHKEIDINFCITWANENWTRRWDGAEHDVLMAQNHCDDDSIKFIESLYKYFEDERYIRIDNKPVLIIYRVDIIPRMKETVELWRKKVKEAGFDGIYLISSQTFGIKSPDPYGFDAAMEFPPHTAQSATIADDMEIYNRQFKGKIYDYNKVVNNAVKSEEPEYKLYRTAMLSWDNTARKQNSSHTFARFSLLGYKQWLSNLASGVFNNTKYEDNEKFIFINAWNEWAEGTHLEPDRKFGYGYLEATHNILSQYSSENDFYLHREFRKNHNIAVILHVHYTDVWEEINAHISNLEFLGFDLYVTVTNIENDIISKISKTYPKACIRLVENRGRDILPFINIYKEIKGFNYNLICKIHSKQSVYRDDGDSIREEIYHSILGDESKIKSIFDMFQNNKDIGLITNKKYLIKHTEHNMTYDKEIVDNLSRLLGVDFKYSSFPAGSMFWFKPEAMSGIEVIESKYFDVEQGLADGTVAHGIERLFCEIVMSNKYVIRGI